MGDRTPEEPGGPKPPLRLSLGCGDVEIGDLGDEQPLVLLLSRPPNRRGRAAACITRYPNLAQPSADRRATYCVSGMAFLGATLFATGFRFFGLAAAAFLFAFAGAASTSITPWKPLRTRYPAQFPLLLIFPANAISKADGYWINPGSHFISASHFL